MYSSNESTVTYASSAARRFTCTLRATSRFWGANQIASRSPSNVRRNQRRWMARTQCLHTERVVNCSHIKNVREARSITTVDTSAHPQPFFRLCRYLFPVGTHVLKNFDGVDYNGFCASHVVCDRIFHYYKIIYEDSDSEDVDQEEMM